MTLLIILLLMTLIPLAISIYFNFFNNEELNIDLDSFHYKLLSYIWGMDNPYIFGTSEAYWLFLIMTLYMSPIILIIFCVLTVLSIIKE